MLMLIALAFVNMGHPRDWTTRCRTGSKRRLGNCRVALVQ